MHAQCSSEPVVQLLRYFNPNRIDNQGVQTLLSASCAGITRVSKRSLDTLDSRSMLNSTRCWSPTIRQALPSVRHQVPTPRCATDKSVETVARCSTPHGAGHRQSGSAATTHIRRALPSVRHQVPTPRCATDKSVDTVCGHITLKKSEMSLRS